MNLAEKVSLIEKALDTDLGRLKPDTKLNELEEWDSLGVVSLIAMLDKHFSVRLQPEKIRSLMTVKDILDQMVEKA